ncbi:MAG: GNAT family N-acetyltransferase [Rhizobiales bacterium]|nr:GNAT family N-acetyltransferase [Hyphomicrobiales bacterium]NRB14928.1 GNAT family N-acetyltransferase [Hyphomicrobiales bacterium]
MATIKTLVTSLEMCQQSADLLPLLPQNVELKLIANIDISDYKALYAEIGQNYCWTSRLLITDDELLKIIHNPNVQIYQLIENDRPIGFFELSQKNMPRSVEISFIGLVDSAIGRGLGRLLAQYAIAHAWAAKPNRIIIQTCTLDHKRALPLYQKLGFKAYNRHVTEFKISND